MVSIRLKGVKKRFGSFEALRGITLDINDGELFFVLGPSGCGKTTLLRVIAGLYEPDEGEVYFGDRLMNGVPAYERNVGMVFQNYALWPHMTVYDNVAYGLKVRGLPKREVDRKVKWALKLVRLEGMENKYPNQLSGGQQQRVALARALVVEPEVLLLDEPLSNLDAKLRVQMRRELKLLQRELKVTTVYVTHDQAEALSMADRIAVMSIGVVEQVGTPEEIYNRPRTKFVADFIGEINFLKGAVVAVGEYVEVETPIGRLRGWCASQVSEGEEVTVGFRPERVKIGKRGLAKLRVKAVMFYGPYEEVLLEGDGVLLKVLVSSEEAALKPGDEVYVSLDPDDVLVFKEV